MPDDVPSTSVPTVAGTHLARSAERSSLVARGLRLARGIKRPASSSPIHRADARSAGRQLVRPPHPQNIELRVAWERRCWAGETPLALGDGVFVSGRYKLWCLDAATGITRWRWCFREPATHPLATARGLLYAADSGSLYAINV